MSANGTPSPKDDAEQHDGAQLRRPAIRALVQDFSPLWFTWCMNAGAIALLLHQCPYRFNGIDILANICFVISLVLYILFSGLFTARFLWFGRKAYDEVINNIAELTFVPCWAIAFMTLTSDVTMIVSTAWWGGYPFAMVAYVMVWFVQAWNVVLLVWAFAILIGKHEALDRRMPTSIIIPAVSMSTASLTGAIVAAYGKGLSARLAVPLMIVSFNWVGVGILTGVILTVYLFHGLLAEGWPAPPQTPTLFILVGPMGQSAAALQVLGAAATTYGRFGDYNTGTFLTAEAAKSLDTACVLLALLMNGLGIIWFIFGVYAMLERALEKKLKWTPAWNAIIFPNATLATSFLEFSIEMDSPAYRVITCIFIVVLVILFLINIWFTALGIWKGELFIVRDDWRVKQQLEEQKEK